MYSMQLGYSVRMIAVAAVAAVKEEVMLAKLMQKSVVKVGAATK